MNNVALVALFLASGVMLVWPEIAKLAGGGDEVGTLQATQLMNQPNSLVLDVRPAEEFAAGHLPRARNIPAAELQGRVGELSKFKEKPVVITCKSGTRAAAASRALKAAGFTRIHPLKGGIAAWQAASLPLEK